jgi:hypothetical protein
VESHRTTSDEVDDFKLIAVVQFRAWPLAARNDLAVQFNGDTVRLHAKVLDQRAQGSGRRRLAFPIDHEVHDAIFAVIRQKTQAA